MTASIDGRYDILEVLGRGSFGETLLAREVDGDRRVAIKTLHAARTDDLKAFELFEREAAVLRTLRHQGVPAILDAFHADRDGSRTAYLVMEYVEGPTLEQLIAGGHSFSADEVLGLVLDLAGILGYLHERVPPILHRDIKPANIILRGGRTPVLVDFGAVRNVFRAPDESGSTVVGTYGYMPYEQYMGQATPASDLYALGATLLHLLTGRPPSDFLTDQSRIEVPDQLPGGNRIRDTLTRLLAPAAADRFPSAAELRQALLRASRDETNLPAIVHGGSVPTVAKAQDALAPLPPGPRDLAGSTLALYDRVAPSMWDLMRNIAGPGSTGGSRAWIVFLSLASFGIVPLSVWISSRTRRRYLKPFFERGVPAVGRIHTISISTSPFDERIARVSYEFEADRQTHRGADRADPRVAERWREGDAVALLCLPDRGYESVIVSTS